MSSSSSSSTSFNPPPPSDKKLQDSDLPLSDSSNSQQHIGSASSLSSSSSSFSSYTLRPKPPQSSQSSSFVPSKFYNSQKYNKYQPDYFDLGFKKSPKSSRNCTPPTIKMAVSPRVIRLIVVSCIFFSIIFFIFSSSSSSSSIIDSINGKQSSTSNSISESTEESSDSFECTKSYDGTKPVNQYVIMIDAGSSGSRVHVYKFNNCLATPRLVSEEFKMLEPGLSSFKDDPEAAAKSLDPLLEVALNTIPKESYGCSPIAVKATAGLRLIGEEAANKTLAAVRAHLENNYPFAVVSDENQGIAIMPGADEGVYAWVTVNYLLGNIVSDPKNKIPISERPPTAAVFDLGGGSTQIVFEPHFKVSGQNLPKGDHRYDIKFGANHYSLYQHSHLGYGLNVARDSMYAAVVSSYLNSGVDINTTPIVNPCLPPGAQLKDVKVKVDSESYVVPNMVGPKEPSMLQCQKIAEVLLKKEAECPVEPCSFNGIYQPSLVSNFMREGDLYVISYFYDRTFPLGMPSAFNIDDLKDLAQKVCRGKESYDSFEAIPEAVSQLKENPQWCGDLAYMLAVLHHGYDIPAHREVKIAKKVKGNELGWCLGASLPLLDQSSAGWSCRISRQQ
ncbi:uncharacterized protein SAPINGB_P003355 [Magnusiomyces paraingens]|uniref:guanosine-diphosphatase n=1 Tax=Magnusiomyces paraingens TaxID=2606893 RepID=A0A5E8BNX4_9ASCO|nr:uncharacterized protein SAPINGB_P003355 [Saprochaete ingens]VVT53003.1 unnamed protein product [Saprochaete ingens]